MYLNSGPAIKCERLDLSIFQENLQDIGDEEKSFFLHHFLGTGRRMTRKGSHLEGQGKPEEGCRKEKKGASEVERKQKAWKDKETEERAYQ